MVNADLRLKQTPFSFLTLALLSSMAGPRPHPMNMCSIQILYVHTPSLRSPHAAAEPNSCVSILAKKWEQETHFYLKWIEKATREFFFSHYCSKT